MIISYKIAKLGEQSWTYPSTMSDEEIKADVLLRCKEDITITKRELQEVN